MTTHDGESSAADLLVRCQDRLLTRIRWMMGEQARLAADSVDFLGDVMARVLRDVESLTWRDEDHFLALTSRIARNIIIDRVRRPRIQRFESFTVNMSAGKVADPNDVTPSDEAVKDEALDAILLALEGLSRDHQQVIELRHFDALDFRAIGTRMGRSENAVQVLHTRAVTALGRLLRR